MNKRLKKLRRTLAKKDLLPYLVSDLTNIRYLTGFTGSYAALVIGGRDSFFLSDSRYEEYVRSILPRDVRFVLQKADFCTTLEAELKTRGESALYCEKHSMSLASFMDMKARMKRIRLYPAEDVVNEQRMVKDGEEIALLREAAAITDSCVNHLKSLIRPGMLECDIAVEIEYFYRKRGCRRTSFDSIVASGAGSSMPHYETSMEKRIRAGDVLLIDMGCHYRGYNSDLTRTLFVNSIDPAVEKLYRVVQTAQQAALEAVRPGITTGKLDGVARNIIVREGYGQFFGHSLGHGLGLDIHELPAVKAGDVKLRKNMVITIEPGIYLPGTGGVRIEDMVLVTGGGCEVLTKSSKDITIV